MMNNENLRLAHCIKMTKSIVSCNCLIIFLMENFIFCAVWCKLNIISQMEGEISESDACVSQECLYLVDFNHEFGFWVNTNTF